MSAAELVELHDQLARERGMAAWRKPRDRAALGQAIGMLRTLRPAPVLLLKATRPPKPKPETPIRDAIIEVLSIVTHFEVRGTSKRVSYDELHLHDINDLRSVGLPYSECLARVKKKVPSSQVNVVQLRGAVVSARKGAVGYVGVTFADCRPHGMKGRGRKFTKGRPRK